MHQLKIIFRKAQQEKLLTSLKLVSLIIGFSAAFIIFLWASQEFRKNHSITDGDQIYRLARIMETNQQTLDTYIIEAPWSPALYQDLPEVIGFTRCRPGERRLLSNLHTNVTGISKFADTTFIDFFNFQLLAGIPASALRDPYSIVLTNQLAQKLFKNVNPIGETITYNNKYEVTVTGILQDPPNNITFPFDCLLSFSTIKAEGNSYMGWGGGDSYVHYLKLGAKIPAKRVEAKIMPALQKYYDYKAEEKRGIYFTPYLQPLKSIYLDYTDDPIRKKIYTLLLTALLIIAVSALNYSFIELSALFKKNKTAAIPMVFGQSIRRSLFYTLIESFCFTALAAFITLAILPIIISLLNTHLQLNLTWDGTDPILWMIILGNLTMFSLLSIIFPALHLSIQKIPTILTGTPRSMYRINGLRNSLMVFQLCISTGILFFTLMVVKQTKLLQYKELGYNRENLIYVEFPNDISITKAQNIRREMLQISGVISSSLSADIPVYGYPGNGFQINNDDQFHNFRHSFIDTAFIHTLNLKLAFGKNLSEMRSDEIIINQTLLNQLEWIDPSAGTISRMDQALKIVGIVHDFHMDKTTNKIKPLILCPIKEGWVNYLSIRLAPGNQIATIRKIKETYKDLMAGRSIEVSYYSSVLDAKYKKEVGFSRLLLLFSALTIFVTVLGLISFIYLTTQQRTKEIGIRKVNGARTVEIVGLYWKKSFYTVLLSLILGFGLTWPVVTNWLAQYPFKVMIDGWVLLITTLTILLVNFSTISWLTWRAALKNPVEALRYE